MEQRTNERRRTNDEPRAPHAILAATDFEPISGLAVQQAWQLATQRADAQLHVVHVVDEPALMPSAEAMRWRAHFAQEMPERLRAYAIGLAQAMDLGPLHRPLATHVRFGSPAPAILQLAADVDAAMIVIGSHGKRGIERMLGSVSKELLDAGRLPVLVSHPKRLEDIEKSAKPEPPCDDCVATRHASGGMRWWCELHARPHVDTQVHESTQRVRYAKPPADFEGYGAG